MCRAGEAPGRDFRQSRQVIAFGPEGLFDLLFGRRNAGSRLSRVPGNTDLGLLGEVDAFLSGLLRHVKGVGWRATQDGNGVRKQSINPLLGCEPARRKHQAAKLLGGEETRPETDPRAVTEGTHNHVRLADAHTVQPAGIASVKTSPVLWSVQIHDWSSCGSRGGMDTEAFLRRNGQDAPPRGVLCLVILQLVLSGEGKQGDVVQRANVPGFETSLVKFPSVKGRVFIGVSDLGKELGSLNPAHGFARCSLDLGFKVDFPHALLRFLRHLPRCRLDGLNDVMIACAPTDCARDTLPDFSVRWSRVLPKDLQGSEKHPRGAESALQRVVLPKSLLKGVQLSLFRKPLDGLHLRAIRLDGEHETGTDCQPVHHYRTATADPVFAAHVRSGKAEALSEEIG